MISSGSLHTTSASLPTITESGTWFRAIQPQFLTTALQTNHTNKTPSRYHPGQFAHPSFEILYLAESHLVALFEVQALLGSSWSMSGVISHPRRAWTILNVKVNLHSVVDLTDTQNQTTLVTTAQELTGDWRGYQIRTSSSSVSAPIGDAPTQKLGEALANSHEGFRTLSAKVPDQMVLGIFPRKLKHGSFVQFWDPTTRKTHYIDNKSTWLEREE